MKLPLPKISLKLPALPFRKGSPDGEAEIGPERPGSRVGHILRIAGMAVLGISVIGGLGATVGWLVVNGADTVADREARRPELTVSILRDGEEAAPNSSLDTMARKMADEHGQMPNDGHGEDVAHDDGNSAPATGKGMPDEIMPEEQKGPRFELALVEETEKGMLPVIAPDGRKAWETYARPFEADSRLPRIAIVMTRMGVSRSLTEAAIEVLPPEISFSFAATAADLDDQVAAAQKAGHEVFLDIPMEPFGYPTNDPGPTTLLTSLSAVDNLNRLETVLGRTVGYAGVMGVKGSQFTTDEEALTPVLSVLKERGLMYVDSAASSRTIALELAGTLQLPRAIANWRIDDSPALAEIQRRLAALERTAQRTGFALGVVPPLPLTIDLIASWAETLPERGIALAPATAIANKQSLR
ncbi:divergent polysaccharide deacetylase family protein [Nisaea acidiphila]|uniref:Divergent polysaccharide deacetylase family protein n=1 Tax=Nisaea acidiphila TaxID=1862145 RepID=A0A9J7ANB8_9PROT|nr:divergent polysaccharide deacetylase family protein [Nisaea acidiphila]UUX48081.1 divergent polysaccharide deacetylase family protein [Nisaea acidiphila]